MRLLPRRRLSFLAVASAAALSLAAGSVLMGLCGPFTDVSDAQFCPFVLEIFTLGITTGTTPTTYSPADNVSRLQMAAFLSRTVDSVLLRGSRRAALDQNWVPQNAAAVALTTVGSGPNFLKSDGADVWVANYSAARSLASARATGDSSRPGRGRHSRAPCWSPWGGSSRRGSAVPAISTSSTRAPRPEP